MKAEWLNCRFIEINFSYTLLNYHQMIRLCISESTPVNGPLSFANICTD